MEPPGYFGVLLAATLAGFFLPLRIVPAPWSYLGTLPVAAGAVLNLWADGIFKRRGTTIKPGGKPTVLVTDGPFGFSRHPIYLGMTLILLGAALLTRCVAALATPLAFVWAMDDRFIPLEEANMRKAFGREYAEYAARVRKWL